MEHSGIIYWVSINGASRYDFGTLMFWFKIDGQSWCVLKMPLSKLVQTCKHAENEWLIKSIEEWTKK